jgi:hypothetical protein
MEKYGAGKMRFACRITKARIETLTFVIFNTHHCGQQYEVMARQHCKKHYFCCISMATMVMRKHNNIKLNGRCIFCYIVIFIDTISLTGCYQFGDVIPLCF